MKYWYSPLNKPRYPSKSKINCAFYNLELEKFLYKIKFRLLEYLRYKILEHLKLFVWFSKQTLLFALLYRMIQQKYNLDDDVVMVDP